jgi:hypothetical protein
MSGIRVFQVVCTHSTLTPRLSASERAGHGDVDARVFAVFGFDGIGFVVACCAHAQLALLQDGVEMGRALLCLNAAG